MDPNAQFQSAATPVAAPAAAPAARRIRPRWLRLPSRGRRPEPQVDPAAMSLGGHLTELRNRVFISVFALLPGTIVGFFLSDEIIRILKAPLPTKDPLITLGIDRALPDQAPGRDGMRGHPGDAGDPLPALAVHLTGAYAARAVGGPAMGACRAGLLRSGRGPGVLHPALRLGLPVRVPDAGAQADAHGGRVLRLRHHALPRFRPGDGVPDHPRPPLEGRADHIATVCGARVEWRSWESRSSRR